MFLQLVWMLCRKTLDDESLAIKFRHPRRWRSKPWWKGSCKEWLRVRCSTCLLFFRKVNTCLKMYDNIPANILFVQGNMNAKAMCEICSKFTMKTPERCCWYCCGVFIVNFAQISQFVLVFLLLTWQKVNVLLD